MKIRINKCKFCYWQKKPCVKIIKYLVVISFHFVREKGHFPLLKRKMRRVQYLRSSSVIHWLDHRPYVSDISIWINVVEGPSEVAVLYQSAHGPMRWQSIGRESSKIEFKLKCSGDCYSNCLESVRSHRTATEKRTETETSEGPTAARKEGPTSHLSSQSLVCDV